MRKNTNKWLATIVDYKAPFYCHAFCENIIFNRPFKETLVLSHCALEWRVSTRARQRAGRSGPGFFDPEKNLILNPESGRKPGFSNSQPGNRPETRARPTRPGKIRPFTEHIQALFWNRLLPGSNRWVLHNATMVSE